MLSSAMAIAALIGASSTWRLTVVENQGASAQTAALAGLNAALAAVRADTSWRSTHPTTWTMSFTLGEAAVTVTLSDADGSLSSSELDPVTIDSVAVVGSARRQVRLTAIPMVRALPIMSYALGANGAVTCGSLSAINSSTAIYTRGNVAATLATVNPDVVAGGSVTGASYKGLTTTGAAMMTLPSSSLVARYAARATSISVSSLPSSLGTRQITRVLLSPASNPFGSLTNPRGWYVIDCGGQNISITDCRIVGTLILINPGSGSSVNGSVLMEPYATNEPCLITDSAFTLNLSASTVNEGIILLGTRVNLNPSGTPYPYPGGTTNANQSDSYPSQIGGLVYVGGNLTISGSTKVNQVISTGSVSISGTLTLNYNSATVATPPAGFYTIDLTPAEGGYMQVYQ